MTKRKSKKTQKPEIRGAKAIPTESSNGAPNPLYQMYQAEERFERACQQVYDQVNQPVTAKQLCELAAKGFEQAHGRRKDKRWPLFDERSKVKAGDDLPQAACILLMFHDVFQEDQQPIDEQGLLISPEMRLKYTAAVAELRQQVFDYYHLKKGAEEEIDLFTTCMTYVRQKFIPDELSDDEDIEPMSWQAKAIALLFEHRDWSVEKVAQKVGRSRKTLYGDSEVSVAIKARNEQKKAQSSLPTGEKKAETGELEAWRD